MKTLRIIWLPALLLAAGAVLSACSTASSEENGSGGAPAAADGPAAAHQFRADPASRVGSTGNPQLIEFFAYW